jgi:hypothetical protein
LDVYWDTSSVVCNFDRVVGVQGDLDVSAIPRQRFVDRVIDQFPDAMCKPSGVGRADVHAGALSNSIKPLKDE